MHGATTIFAARKIITMNRYQPEASHVAVRDGRVLGDGGRRTNARGLLRLRASHANHFAHDRSQQIHLARQVLTGTAASLIREDHVGCCSILQDSGQEMQGRIDL